MVPSICALGWANIGAAVYLSALASVFTAIIMVLGDFGAKGIAVAQVSFIRLGCPITLDHDLLPSPVGLDHAADLLPG